jgi:hypothetical protein
MRSLVASKLDMLSRMTNSKTEQVSFSRAPEHTPRDEGYDAWSSAFNVVRRVRMKLGIPSSRSKCIDRDNLMNDTCAPDWQTHGLGRESEKVALRRGGHTDISEWLTQCCMQYLTLHLEASAAES